MKKAEAFFATCLKQLNSLNNRLKVSAIVFCFAFLFLFLFKPFGMDYWISDTFGKRSFILFFICFYAFIVILISQTLQHFLFKNRCYKMNHFFGFVLLELIIISVPLAYLSANEHSSFFNELVITCRLIGITLLLCYLVAMLIWIVIRTDIRHTSDALSEKSVTDAKEQISQDLFIITDESGNQRFVKEAKNLLYFSSEDNYVMIHYLEEGVCRKQLVRSTLKGVEEEALKSGCIRCHRSFIVNKTMIQSVKRFGRNYQIQLLHSPEILPVSKSYESGFISFQKVNDKKTTFS
ncbi:MAG: LytTR family DNA-binding domain-containing protein [Bacteroidales bacterium]